MAVVLFSLAALIGKAGRSMMNGSSYGASRRCRKCRHEKNIQSEDAEAFFKRNAGLMLRYTDLTVSIQEKGAKRWEK